jgi:glycosyltransferase involved in cell wall biosynthesis
MKILTILTYYRPHTSGLTIYGERLAKSLVQLGHEVTILTSQYDNSLLREEFQDGVRIIRAPVLFRISKGVIMPTFGWLAWKLALSHDVIHLHLPQFDAAGAAFLGRLVKKPTVITYHCDLILPKGFFNKIVNMVVYSMNNLAGLLAHRIGAYTEDFASHSPYLQRFANKVKVILPPVELPDASQDKVQGFSNEHNPNNKSPIIGMATRFAAEKGVEVLLESLPKIMEHYPNTLVLYAGQYLNVFGEEDYYNRLLPQIKKYQAEGQWKFLGVLDPDEMALYYPILDVLVVPSLNSTETFGLVQIEAMINGTPTVASDLPGVRQPSKMTGMGEIAQIGDPESLAQAVMRVLAQPQRYRGDPKSVASQFNPLSNASAYENLYRELIEEMQ